jgi:hypothetical protein
MDKQDQIAILRREHEDAVERYDFKRARNITTQINTLRSAITTESRSSKFGRFDFAVDEREEQILGEWELTKAQLMQEQVDLQQTFHERYQHIQDQYAEQLRKISLRHTIALEREASRAVPEADKLFARSKQCARALKYELAESAFKEATQIKEQILQQRRENCNAAYTRSESLAKQNLEKELNLLAFKQEAAFQNHNQKKMQFENVIEKKKIVGQSKVNQRPHTRTSARRSRSVTKS